MNRAERLGRLFLGTLIALSFSHPVAYADAGYTDDLLSLTSDAGPVARPPQYVLLAFDGSEGIDRWDDTIGVAKNSADANGNLKIKYTYFASGVMFLGRTKTIGQQRSDPYIDLYKSPQHDFGQSNIGFSSFTPGNTGENEPEISKRIQRMNLALATGLELGSHLNAHYESGTWNAAQWDQEFTDFNNLLFNSKANNQKEYMGSLNPNPSKISSPLGQIPPYDRQFLTGLNYKPENIKGFRAPLLAQNAAMYPVLAAHGFTYDTSRTAPINYWPEQLFYPVNGKKVGVWNFPLASLILDGCVNGAVVDPKTGKTHTEQCHTLSMDYNLLVSQAPDGTRGSPAMVTDPELQAFFQNQVLETYRKYFKANYYGNRAPINIGHHFALWSGGIYWNAMRQFAQEVCVLKEVKCITYSELEKIMTHVHDDLPKHLAAYRSGQFPKFTQAALTAPQRDVATDHKGKRTVSNVDLLGDLTNARADLDEKMTQRNDLAKQMEASIAHRGGLKADASLARQLASAEKEVVAARIKCGKLELAIAKVDAEEKVADSKLWLREEYKALTDEWKVLMMDAEEYGQPIFDRLWSKEYKDLIAAEKLGYSEVFPATKAAFTEAQNAGKKLKELFIMHRPFSAALMCEGASDGNGHLPADGPCSASGITSRAKADVTGEVAPREAN